MTDNSSQQNKSSHTKTLYNNSTLSLRSTPYFIHIDTLYLSYIFHNSTNDLDSESKILCEDIHQLQKFKFRKFEVHNDSFYQYHYTIHYKNKIFASFEYGTKVKNNISSLKINNKALYLYSENELYDIIKKLEGVLNMNFNNVSEYHIALDVAFPIRDIIGVFYTHSNKYYINYDFSNIPKNQQLKKFYDFTTKTKIDTSSDNSTYYIGASKRSNLKGKKKGKKKIISIYDKSQEAEKGKDWQLDIIKEQLGNPQKNINRVELRLNNEAIKNMAKRFYKIEGRDNLFNIQTDDLRFFLNPNNYRMMFKIGIGNEFEVKDLRTKYIDKNRHYKYEKINIIDLSTIGEIENYDYITPTAKKDPSRILQGNRRNLNNGLKGLLDSYISTNDNSYFEKVKDIIKNDLLNIGLNDYIRKIKEWRLSPKLEVLNDIAFQRINLYLYELELQAKYEHYDPNKIDKDLEKMEYGEDLESLNKSYMQGFQELFDSYQKYILSNISATEEPMFKSFDIDKFNKVLKEDEKLPTEKQIKAMQKIANEVINNQNPTKQNNTDKMKDNFNKLY